MPLEPQSGSQPGCYGCPTHGRPENKCYEKGHRAIIELLLESSWVLQNDRTSTIQRGTEISETVWGVDDGWSRLVPISISVPATQKLKKQNVYSSAFKNNPSYEPSFQSAKGWGRSNLESFSILSCLSFTERTSTWKSESSVREGSCLSCSDRERLGIHGCPKL